MSSCHKVSSEFLETNAHDPHNWTLSSCFHVFLSVWVHLGPFRYCTKLGAKCAKLVQLMQKFMPRCRVRIFRNERSQYKHWTLNSCFGAFLSVWGHLEPFCYRMNLAAKRAKLVQVMPRCLVRSFCNEHSQSTPLDPKLMFGCISLNSSAFGNSFATTQNFVHNAQNWCN